MLRQDFQDIKGWIELSSQYNVKLFWAVERADAYYSRSFWIIDKYRKQHATVEAIAYQHFNRNFVNFDSESWVSGRELQYI